MFESQFLIIDFYLKNSITIIIALVAGIIALYQVKYNIVSSSRIKWIKNLRLLVSEYYDAVLSTTLFLTTKLKTRNTELEKDKLH